MKHRNTTRIATLAATALLVATLSTPALAGEPTAVVKKTDTKLRALLGDTSPEGSARAARVQKRLTATVDGFLDFEELARQALKRHWEPRTAEERAEFVRLLRDLIERNYLKQLKKNLDYRVEYRDEVRKGDRAKVVTAVHVTKNNRPAVVVIEYKMMKNKKDGRWMVYDVVTDDVSIVRNYRSQFNRIIKKNSYEHLVKKMRRKLEKGEAKNT